MGEGSIAFILGASSVVRSADTEYPFRQDSDFWYLTGFGHPDAVAVLRSDGGPVFTLFVQPRDRDAETWTGYRPGVEGAVSDYGADEAHPIGELLDRLPTLIEGAERIFHQLGRRQDIDRKLTETLESIRRRSRMGVTPADSIVDPRSVLHEMRLFKSEAELEILRRAAAITREGHEEAAKIAHSGHFEYELEAVLDYTYRRRGGSGPAYATIVGGGANAAILHYITNDQPLRDGELLLIDSGAELEGYASDVTRTYPVGGHFSPEQRDAYEVVLDAQERAIELSRPGATLDEIHDAALRRLVEGMHDLGLLSGSVDESIEKGSFARYYMHRTSHWLGLDVHDAGSYSAGKSARKLEPGMVFTVEPGLYVPPDDEAKPSLAGTGIRIEDDIVVTPSGCENLNTAIPKKAAEIEAWVQRGL